MADQETVHDATYWRKKAEELERELEDFRESSQMLEKELEASLEQSEKTIKELRLKNNSLQLENDNLKDKYDLLQRATETQVSELEEETNQWHKREEEYVKYIRELEQKNDDLERSQRAMYTSLGEFKTKLNYALERNVLLESELDEKESLKTMVQRLKDEARDLKQEIQVREKLIISTQHEKAVIVDSNKMENDIGVQSGGHNNVTTAKNMNSANGLMTASSRISAMNIVGDLLRKVGALESKLASCRGSPRESISTGDLAVRDQYRSRRLNRGTSTPSIHNLARSS